MKERPQPPVHSADEPTVKRPRHEGGEPVARRPAHEPRSVGRQGHHDIEHGLEDTDRWGGDDYQQRTQNDEHANCNSQDDSRENSQDSQQDRHKPSRSPRHGH